MSTQVQWLAPPPLWEELSKAADPTPFRRPTILRFATDTFMQDLQGVLQSSPQTLRDYVAQVETWRNPAAGLDNAGAPPLKLYQPTHARFYVVATSLTCRMPGLPDHTVNKTAGENVVFVVRQLRPKTGYSAADCDVYDPAKCSEYAWIPATASAATASSTASASSAAAAGIQNASGTQPGWMLVNGPGQLPDHLIAGEEQIPLSQTTTGRNGSSRRIFIGLIPASRRQQYIAGRTLPSSSGTNGNGTGNGSANGNGAPTDPRVDMFYRQVIAPWCNLQAWWTHLASPSADDQNSAKLASALILYDFSTFLSLNIPQVWSAITGSTQVAALNGAESTLYNMLSFGLPQALLNANKSGPEFESLGPSTDLPSDYTPFALTDISLIPTTLQTPVTNALPPLNTVQSPPPSLPPTAQKPSNATGDYRFIVRCVYLRPQCPFNVNVVSPPCQPFQLASYFDSDAPARRIQVALPIDTSAAALRNYDKGVAFMIGKELRNQMARVASLDDLSKGNIGSGGSASVGWICSLSIPIITICAMILLFVIVIALNLVFFWIPFFKICLPVPGLEGD